MAPSGRKIAPERGLKRQMTTNELLRNPEALTELARRGAIKVVKQPRPTVPWKAAAVRKKGKKGGSSFMKALGLSSSSQEGQQPTQEEDEEEEAAKREAAETMEKSRKKFYCVRTVVPFVFFAIGLTLLLYFLAMLINVVNREDGQCTTIRFKRGKDCKDCAFEIKVDGVEKSGFINVRFDADGAPEISAYEKCGTTDCCAFRTSFDPDTGDSTFCDDAPWDCNYRLATGNMPQDLEEGQLVVRMVPLYIGLIFLFLFWPSISIWNMIQDNKYMQRLQANLEKRTSFGQNNPDAGHHGRTTGSRSGSRGGNRPIENV